MTRALQTKDIGYTNCDNRQGQSPEISLESNVYLAFKHNTPNRFKLLDKLERANISPNQQLSDKTTYLGEKAKKVARVVMQKLSKRQTVVVNHKYLSKITRCKPNQNKNILREMDKMFVSKYYRVYDNNGKKLLHHYHIALHPDRIEELKEAGLFDSEFYPQKIGGSYNNNKDIINNNKNRSSTHTRKANSFANSNFISESANADSVETKTDVVTEKQQREATVHILKPKKARASTRHSNKRRKTTNAQKKTNRVRLLSFRQYSKPQNLQYHYPLTKEDAEELIARSGRNYNLNAQNHILLDMSKKDNLKDRTFCSKAQFMAYMTKTLSNEIRDPEMMSRPNYYIRANLTDEQLKEQKRLARKERFLNAIEQQSITHRSDDTQFRAKLVGTLGTYLAYDILSNLGSVCKNGEVFELRVSKIPELTECSRDIILSQANAVGGYHGVTKLEFISGNNRIPIDESNSRDNGELGVPGYEQADIGQQDYAGDYYGGNEYEDIHLPSGVWGDISRKLIDKYGMDIYKHWFSKLTASINEDMGVIELKAASSMVEDWISSKYEHVIVKIADDMGMELTWLNRYA